MLACIWSWTKSAKASPQWARNAKKSVMWRCVQSIWNCYCKWFASAKNTPDWCVSMHQILNQICKASPQWARNAKKYVVWRCVQSNWNCYCKCFASAKNTLDWCVSIYQILNQICKASPQWVRNARKYVSWRCAKCFKFVNASALQVQKTHRIDVLPRIRSWTKSARPPHNGLEMQGNMLCEGVSKVFEIVIPSVASAKNTPNWCVGMH